jgi:hypothetical protein
MIEDRGRVDARQPFDPPGALRVEWARLLGAVEPWQGRAG